MYTRSIPPSAYGKQITRQERALRLVEECRRLQFESICIEFEVAITFCECASTTQCLERKNLALASAAAAYRSASIFTEAANLSESMAKDIESLGLRLNSLLIVARGTPCKGEK